MPKLKTLSLTFRPPVGADVTLDVQISVDGAGVFWGLVPMEFVEDIRTAIERANIGERSCPSTPRRGHGTSVTPVWRSGWRTKPTDSPFKTYGSDVWLEHSMYWLKNGAHVGSRDLSELEALLKEAGEESVKASTDTKLVLRYCLMTRVSYAKGPDGKLYQSRGAAPGHDAEFKGSLHATNDATSYAIGVGAQVVRKTVYTRMGATRTEYTYANREELGPEGLRLRNFIGLSPSIAGYGKNNSDGTIGEIPYTEEGARFFNELILQIVGMADALDTFLGTPEKTAAAIERGAQTTIFALPQD